MATSPSSIRVSQKRLRQLMDELRSGESQALATLLDLYRPYLLATARARLEDRLKAKAGPSDLVQETLAKAHQIWIKLENKPQTEQELRTWLRNILLERLKVLRRRYYRAKSRSLRREQSLDEGASKRLLEKLVAAYSETPGAIYDQDILIEQLQLALERLPPEYRQVVLWRNRDGWHFADIGGRIGRSAEAARKLWSRALKILRKELRGLRDGDA